MAQQSLSLSLRPSVLACVVALMPQVALAQDDSVATLQTRVQGLESEVRELQAQLRALAGRPGSAPPADAAASAAIGATPSPSSAATPSEDVARGEAGGAAGSKTPTARPRIYPAGTPTSAAVASIQAGRPVITSDDGQFTVNLLGVMHFDVADYDQRPAGPLATDERRGGSSSDAARARDLSSGSDFRRARLGLAGKAFGSFEYSFLYEFGGSGEEDAGHVQELWLQYSGLKPLHLRVGAFAPIMGLEDAGSTNGMMFLERPSVSEVTRSLAGGDYRQGLQLVANRERWFVSASVTGRTVGVVNSTASGVTQPYDSQLGFVGRAAVLPIDRGADLIHLGLHGSYVASPADATGPDGSATAARYAVQLRDRPELRVDGTRLIDTGAIDARHAGTLGVEAALQHGPLLLQGEYEHIEIDRRDPRLSDPGFSGFYVEGSVLLTGERRHYSRGNFAFDGPAPKRNFSLTQGGWGAVEAAVRYSTVDLNYHQGSVGAAPTPDAVRGGDQKILAFGLNWYLNPITRVMLDWQHVKVDRLSPNATTYGTSTGAQIGQSYDTSAARFQIAF